MVKKRTNNPKRNIFVDLSKQKLTERGKNMLSEFKSFNKDALELDEIIELAAFGRLLRTEFEAAKVPEPEYVAAQLNELRREIDARMADRRATRVHEIKAQLQTLKTNAEKKADLELELSVLEQV